jgi:hypothetical protein
MPKLACKCDLSLFLVVQYLRCAEDNSLLPACLEYLPTIELDQLPCRGCNFYTRTRQQWGVFQEEVDDVQPISIRRGLADTEACDYVDSLSSKEILEEQMHYPSFFGYKITSNQSVFLTISYHSTCCFNFITVLI